MHVGALNIGQKIAKNQSQRPMFCLLARTLLPKTLQERPRAQKSGHSERFFAKKEKRAKRTLKGPRQALSTQCRGPFGPGKGGDGTSHPLEAQKTHNTLHKI